MTFQVYRTTGFLSRSVLQAELVREIETDEYPEDPQALADEYDGDILETATEEGTL
jgi:hypothetical protein